MALPTIAELEPVNLPDYNELEPVDSPMPTIGELEAVEAPSFWRTLEYGFETTPSDVQNLALIAEAWMPLGNFDFGSMDYTSPEELYGPEFMNMSFDERRAFLQQQRQQQFEKEYADVLAAGEEDSAGAMIGSLGGALASPTTLIPVGQSYKAVAAISAALGTEYNVLSQYAEKGTVDPLETGAVAGASAILGPTTKYVGNKINNLFFKKENADFVAQADATAKIDKVNDAFARAVSEDVPVADMATYVQQRTGLTSDDILEASTISGNKPFIPTKAQARVAVAVPQHGVDTISRAKDSWLDQFITPISSRLEAFDPQLALRLRNLDLKSHELTHKRILQTEDFGNVYNKVPTNYKPLVDKLIANNDINELRSLFAKLDPNGAAAVDKVRNVLDDIYKELKKAGYKELGYLKNYLPRSVKDSDKLINALGKEKQSMINKAFGKRAAQLKVPVSQLPQAEKDKIINNIARGYEPKINNAGMSFTRNRTLTRLDDELLQYYENPLAALHSYIRSASHNIERRKFFGQNAVDVGETMDTEQSIGRLIEGMYDKFSQKDLDTITSLMRARFINGEKGAGNAIQALRNVGYMTTLGNPFSAMTQIADMSMAAYANGIRNTLASILGKKRITMQELGLDDVLAEEFANEKLFSKSLHRLFTISGFRQVDRLGKNTILNAALRKAEKQSKSKAGIDSLRKKYGQAFGEEFNSLVDDLQAGKITDNVKLYLWNELAERQPIALSEMPQKYLEVPNGRLLYALKTFTLKQMDMLRKDIAGQWAKGNKKEAVRNLVAYAALVPTVNVSIDMAKDLILQRDINLETDELADRYVANIFKIFGSSEYIMENYGAKGKLATAFEQMVLPPWAYIDSVGTTLFSSLQGDPDPAFLKEVPMIGRFWYNFFGGGLEKYQGRAEQERFGSTGFKGPF